MFECQRCGECCKKFAGILRFETSDWNRWCKEGRVDILSHSLVEPSFLYYSTWGNIITVRESLWSGRGQASSFSGVVM